MMMHCRTSCEQKSKHFFYDDERGHHDAAAMHSVYFSIVKILGPDHHASCT